jgi:hypothetical protein
MDMPKYEIWDVGGRRWEDVSEKGIVEALMEIIDQIEPIMNDMLHAKEAITPYGIYRLKY